MPRLTRFRTLLLALAGAALLSACATQPFSPGGSVESGTSGRSGETRDPLIDAPHRALMTCTSETPVTILKHVNEVSFACPDLGVSATLDELRDAGWRILSLDIGEDTESDSHVGFPVTVQVRKLF